MSTSGNAGGKKIACNLVEHINLASRAVLETALQTDDQVDKTIAFDLDLNLLMKDVPLAKTGGRSLSEYFEISEIAKDQIDRALESTPEKPGSSLPYSSLSNWQPFVVEGDELDAVSIFTADNKSGDTQPFSKIIEQEILEMRTLQNSGADADDESGEGNTQIIQGVVSNWLDQKDGTIVGNVGTDGTQHKNFLHSFLSSSQLDELVRSSVELSLYCTPQPNRMVSGGEDTSEASVAEAHDSLNNRDDFGKVYPQPTSADKRWTSFLKLREDDLWIFKLRLSIHDDDLSAGGTSSRLYRFIFRQKDTVPSSLTLFKIPDQVGELGGADDKGSHDILEFRIGAPAHAPATNEIEYTGSLTHLGVHLTQDGKAPAAVQYLVDPNTLFHTGERLKQEHLQGPAADLQDGFLCALVPASQDACVELVRPIFAVAQAAIKERGAVGTITQLHPIQDLDAQVSRYVEHKRCLVVPASDWHQMKDPTDSSLRVQKLFDDGEKYREYPTCHVRVQCGSGAEFELQFQEDSEVEDDPNSGDLTAVRLTGVKLVGGGSGYLPSSGGQEDDPDFYTFYLKGNSGEYMPHQVENGQTSFHTFMMDNFEVTSDRVWAGVEGVTGVIAYPADYQRIMAADESEMSVELRQGDRVCHFTSMSEAIQLPLFHNQDVQGDGSATDLSKTSFSPYTHTFQNHSDRTSTEHKTYQPIQQNMASELKIQYPPRNSYVDENFQYGDYQVENLDTFARLGKLFMESSGELKHMQYGEITPYLECGGFGERGGNYHQTIGTTDVGVFLDTAAPDDKTEYRGKQEVIFGKSEKTDATYSEKLEGAYQKSVLANRYMNSRRIVLKHAVPGLKGANGALATSPVNPDTGLPFLLEGRTGSYVLLPIEDTSGPSAEKRVFAVWDNDSDGKGLELWAEGTSLLEDIAEEYNLAPDKVITIELAALTLEQFQQIYQGNVGGDPEEYFDVYHHIRDEIQTKLLFDGEQVVEIATFEQQEYESSAFQLKQKFRFWRKPMVCELTGYGNQSFFRMDQDGSSCTLDSWGFASRGIHFERLDAEAVRALSQAEQDALPSVRVIDQQTSTQIAVRLVDVEESASTVDIEFFMGYGMTVKVELLRDYIYKKYQVDLDGKLLLDYTVQVHFSKPVDEGTPENALEHYDDGPLVAVDPAAKTITLNIRVKSNNATLLHDQSDNHEITLGDVHRLLDVYSDRINTQTEAGDGCVIITLPADRDIDDYDDGTSLSGGPGDTWFETAHTFSHGGGQVTLPCRYWETKQVELLKDACTAFEANCKTGLIPKTSGDPLRLDSEIDLAFLEELKIYFEGSEVEAKSAEFAFYGEIAVKQDSVTQTNLNFNDDTQVRVLKLTISDTNLLRPDTLTAAAFGSFLYANHKSHVHGKRPDFLRNGSDILPFEEASTILTYKNIPRDYVVRAYSTGRTGSSVVEMGNLLTYDINYLGTNVRGVEGNTYQEDIESFVLVGNVDQRVVPQATFAQK